VSANFLAVSWNSVCSGVRPWATVQVENGYWKERVVGSMSPMSRIEFDGQKVVQNHQI
jgi:hypothetical protein